MTQKTFSEQTETPHTALTRGEPVLVAGGAGIAGGAGVYFGLIMSNHSGHYEASNASLDFAVRVFRDAGIDYLSESIHYVNFEAEDLKDLAKKDRSEIQRWLRESQPSRDSERAFWWESLATRALHEVYHAGSDHEKRCYASVVKAVTAEAVELAVLSPVDGAIRIANLVAVLGEQGRELFGANQVVKECLAHIGLPFDVAARQAGDWRALPRSSILALRRAKILVSASSMLRDRVTDTALLAELTRWVELRGQLP